MVSTKFAVGSYSLSMLGNSIICPLSPPSSSISSSSKSSSLSWSPSLYSFFIFLKLLLVYLESMGRGRGRGKGEKEFQTDFPPSAEPNTGLPSHNPESKTWAEIKCPHLTNWTTQHPEFIFLSKLYAWCEAWIHNLEIKSRMPHLLS